MNFDKKTLGTLLVAGTFLSVNAIAAHNHNNFDHFLSDVETTLNGVEQGNFPHATDHLCAGYVSLEDQPEDIPPYQEWEESFGIQEAEFRSRNDAALKAYQPITQALGGTLRINNKWSDGTVNANASKQGGSWVVNMYGGMARLAKVTGDGYNVVLCHEVGHLVAGFPFYRGSGKSSMSNEGNSDYWAVHACFNKLFGNEKDKNEEIAEAAPEKVKDLCSAVHDDDDRKNLCIRSLVAGHNIQFAFARGNPPVIGKKDPKVVRQTSHGHPQSQCRVNTTSAGSLCAKAGWTDTTYPNSEADMNKHSCGKEYGDYLKGSRPKCWFAPR